MKMRSHVHLPLALAAAALLGSCQDYNFSTVNYCLIQPGTERVTLSDVSTADILFVVDDSGSMGGEQAKLAASFQAFVDSLKASNVARVAAQLEPIDFHIAVTTTSVFLNAPTTATCSTSCGGAAGQRVCCDSVNNQPLPVSKTCGKDADCSSGHSCRTDCLGRSGEATCCSAAAAAPELVAQACPAVGQPCGKLQNRYVVPRSARLCSGGTDCAHGPDPAAPNPAPAGYACRSTCLGLAGQSACCTDQGVTWRDETCVLGVGKEGALYPRGDFVRAGTNPRVLHFTKDLFCPGVPPGTVCGPRNDAAIDALVTQFKQNVNVGTCGSGQEQGLEAARRAIQKALNSNATPRPADVQPDLQPGEWLHDKSKLVVVFVGDEDDCSGPEDASTGVIFAVSGTDACFLDAQLPAEQQRQYKLQQYADFLTTLNRPVAGAFIVSAKSETCVDDACKADLCCDTACTGNGSCGSSTCGGQAPGTRFLALKDLIRKGADTVAGSVCDPGDAANPGFSTILKRVAEVVKQPSGLKLPTQPASATLTVLRIAGANGKTRKTCYGPAPKGTTQAQAEGASPPYDWWFTDGSDTNRAATGPTRFVYINRSNRACEANPGETYSADYLGLLPAIDGCASAVDCAAAIGGTADDWTCAGYEAGVSRGSCVCGSSP
jgi:hypothetical protein